MLRPGNAGGSEDSSDLLTRLIKKIKKRFPKSRVIVRGDCAFGHSEILDTLENLNREMGKISYTLGITGNSVLKKRSQSKFDSTLKKWEIEGSAEKKLIKYGSTRYKAESWSCQRRVIYKVEISSKKKSRRFVVTNMRKAPRKSYEEYRKRGQCENWINDFKNGVDGDRLSCTDWFTNQFRFFMHSFSYVIMNEFRLLNKNTEYGVMRLWNIRAKLLKVSVSIKKTARAIRLRLPISFPFQKRWLELLTELK
ncbi:MAG: transposase [bacterium]|nr:transposase [bacterium]